MNSKGFRETFLRNDREGPTKAEMAGKKEDKQKAGPLGQIEKNREETGSSTGTKSTSEEVGQRTAQNTQRREAHRDLKGQGESKKPSMTKRRQARKVATMVKRLKKNPEDGESQPPAEAGADLASGDGWDAQQQATVTAYAQSRGMQPREVLQALVNSMEKTLRKEKGGSPVSQIPPPSMKPEEPHEDPNPSPSSVKKGDRREDGEVWPSLEEQRRRAEEEYDKLGGLSHGCRQSWDLRMREGKGPGRKINGLFHWISEDSLILHEVARAAGLEGRGSARRVNSLRMKDMESTCAYCVLLTDWKGEVKYLWARGVDYIEQLPGSEDPRRWYDRFPGLVEARDAEAEEKAPIEMMIAKDNWKWMPVRQASRLTERHDDTKPKTGDFWPELSSEKDCCSSHAWRPARLSLRRKMTRTGTPREGSVGIPWPPQECWTKRRRRTRYG